MPHSLMSSFFRTTGGSGGPVVIVTTLADLKTYVNDEIPRIVVIKGVITGAESVRIKSNKTVIGANSSSGKYLNPELCFLNLTNFL